MIRVGRQNEIISWSYPCSFTNYVAGCTRISVLDFMLSTCAGLLPGTTVWVRASTTGGGALMMSSAICRIYWLPDRHSTCKYACVPRYCNIGSITRGANTGSMNEWLGLLHVADLRLHVRERRVRITRLHRQYSRRRTHKFAKNFLFTRDCGHGLR